MSDMDLRRYDDDYDGWEHHGLYECPDGEYVKYDDVAPIIEEVKRLREDLAALRAQVAEVTE